MKRARIVLSAMAVLGLLSAASAQQAMKGRVASVDEASGKIAITLAGTVGSNDATSPTKFKVQDGLVFNAIKPGDEVSFMAKRDGDDMVITKIDKQ